MKVTRATSVPPLTLGDIKPGEAFRFPNTFLDTLYMRVSTVITAHMQITNVCINTGALDRSALESHVVRVDAEVIEK